MSNNTPMVWTMVAAGLQRNRTDEQKLKSTGIILQSSAHIEATSANEVKVLHFSRIHALHSNNMHRADREDCSL